MYKVAELNVTTVKLEREGCALYANDEMDGIFIALGNRNIEIPESAVLEIVGYFVRKQMVTRWEQMKDTEVLEYLLGKVV